MVRSGASPRLPAAVGKSLANASPTPFWLDQPDAPESLPALAEHVTTGLAVVGEADSGELAVSRAACGSVTMTRAPPDAVQAQMVPSSSITHVWPTGH